MPRGGISFKREDYAREHPGHTFALVLAEHSALNSLVQDLAEELNLLECYRGAYFLGVLEIKLDPVDQRADKSGGCP